MVGFEFKNPLLPKTIAITISSVLLALNMSVHMHKVTRLRVERPQVVQLQVQIQSAVTLIVAAVALIVAAGLSTMPYAIPEQRAMAHPRPHLLSPNFSPGRFSIRT